MNRARLVFDGDCGFCRYTVDYARELTGPQVEYQPYQEVLADYPDLSADDFLASIWLMGADGRRQRGADAAFSALEIGGRPGLAWAYHRIPGFGRAAEWAYRMVSRRRPVFHRLSRALFGPELRPGRFIATAELGARLIGLAFFMAFASYATQIVGLNGSEGILPVADYLQRAHAQLGDAAYWRVPTLFWFWSSDTALLAICWLGALAGLLAASGYALRIWLAICFLFYLSLQTSVQVFMRYQWDLLMLEAGVLGLLVVGGSRPAIWVARLTMFRFMFMGGMVKILSGDVSWRDLTALDWHFYTQPLPNPLAWYAHNAPDWLRQGLTGGTLFVELLLPVLIIMPRRLRHLGAWAFIALETGILVTGNYNFFNLLTIFLCVFLFDDQALRRVLPARLFSHLESRAGVSAGGWRALPMTVMCALLVVTGASLTWTRATQSSYPELLTPLYRVMQNVRLVGGYGPFAVMTKQRDEIVLEGSADGVTWLRYELPYKPDQLDRMPGQVAPHQPRVDWQMWFASLSNYQRQPWFTALAGRLLSGSDDVEALFEVNPFPEEPPRAIRARLYRYTFTTPEQRAETGDWWVREDRGLYLPSVRLTLRAQEPSDD
jgi:Lipase maturation factor/DCC1-like thiol-disulfide oxidoreductase